MAKKSYAAINPANLLTGRFASRAYRVALNAGISFFSGLLAARATILGGLSPFGIALVAVSSKGDSIFTLLGACIGYLLPLGPEYPVRYVAASTMVFICKWLFSSAPKLEQKAYLSTAIAASGCLLTGIAVVTSGGMQLADMVNLFAETLICACSAFFFDKAVPLLRQPSKLWRLERDELTCVIITFGVLLLALSKLSFSGISFGRILGVVTVLVAARYGGEAGGCMTGAAIGAIFALGDKNMLFILGGYAFGGLIAGVFSATGRFGCALSFVLANAVVGIIAGSSTQLIAGLYEVMAATFIFMVLPEKLLCRFSAVFFPVMQRVDGKTSAGGILTHLHEAAAALGEVGETISQVGSRLQGLESQDITAVYSNAADITCKRCGMRMYCWGTAYNDTMSAFNDMTDTLEQNGELARDDVPRHFAGRCCRLGDLLASVNRCYGEYNTRRCEQRRAEMLRGVLIEELGGLELLLLDIAVGAQGKAEISRNDEEIRAAFASCGLSLTDSVCRADAKGRLEIEAVLEKKGKIVIKKEELLTELSAAAGRRLDGPFVLGNDRSLTLSFSQRPLLTCDTGKASIRKNGETLCGDAAEFFTDERGRTVLMLSDGMGCGGSAAVDSNLTLRLMTRLIQADVSFESAFKLVNAAMMLKSGEESFATLDIAVIDRFTGETNFLKAGSPPTYVRRCGRVERMAQASMPAGILRGVKLEQTSARLRKDDLVVIVSDGMLGTDDTWLVKAVEGYIDEPPEAFAQSLAKKAKSLRSDGHDDDATVLVTHIV